MSEGERDRKEKIRELEEEPPEKLEDWPDDEGGKVTVEGEDVDADEFKSDPIPGGPTDKHR
jgi:hypothetical protein